MADNSPPQTTLDLVAIPGTGYAAYWLSVKRLLDSKRGPQALAEELQYATEPYTRLLLSGVASQLEDAAVARMARNKSGALLGDLRRKLGLMRHCACAVALAENPRRTLITLCGDAGMTVHEEAGIMERAQALIDTMRAGDLDTAVFPDVGPQTRMDELVLKLLFFTLWARREGKTGLQPFLAGISFPYLADGLRLCVDGLEEGFIRRRLESLARDTVAATAHKMRMGLDLALAVKARRPYDEVLALARSFLLDL